MLTNVGGLALLLFFVYAVLGVHLFGELNANQVNLNRHTTFADFGSAMLTLVRVATGEDWTYIMCATLPTHPHRATVCPSPHPPPSHRITPSQEKETEKRLPTPQSHVGLVSHRLWPPRTLPAI